MTYRCKKPGGNCIRANAGSPGKGTVTGQTEITARGAPQKGRVVQKPGLALNRVEIMTCKARHPSGGVKGKIRRNCNGRPGH